MRKRRQTKLIHEGKYVAEVDIEIIDSEDRWSPYLSLEDAQRLDDVRRALQYGKIEIAETYGKVFELTQVHS